MTLKQLKLGEEKKETETVILTLFTNYVAGATLLAIFTTRTIMSETLAAVSSLQVA